MGMFTKKETFDDDPIAKRVMGAFILLALEIIVIAAFIPREFTERQIAKEIEMVEVLMGREHAISMQETARTWFNDAFIKTGVYDATFRFFIPSEEQKRKSKGMEDFGEDNIFPFVEKTLISIWSGILQSTLRIAHYLMWWPFLILACLPAILDATYERKIKQAGFRHASAIRYRYAINMLMLVVTLFAFSVFFPLAIPPVLIPLGFACLAVAFSFIFSNLQKKI